MGFARVHQACALFVIGLSSRFMGFTMNFIGGRKP